MGRGHVCIASAAPHPKGAGPQHPQKFIATSTYTSTVLPRATRFITKRGEGGVSLGSCDPIPISRLQRSAKKLGPPTRNMRSSHQLSHRYQTRWKEIVCTGSITPAPVLTISVIRMLMRDLFAAANLVSVICVRYFVYTRGLMTIKIDYIVHAWCHNL